MFVDTTILVSARILEAPHHEIARARLQSAFDRPEPLRISRQVVREYLAILTRPKTWPAAITRAGALDDARRVMDAFEVLEETPSVSDRLIAICRRVAVSGRQIHDANIIATMLAHKERRLLTLDGASFRRYSKRIALVADELDGVTPPSEANAPAHDATSQRRVRPSGGNTGRQLTARPSTHRP